MEWLMCLKINTHIATVPSKLVKKNIYINIANKCILTTWCIYIYVARPYIHNLYLDSILHHTAALLLHTVEQKVNISDCDYAAISYNHASITGINNFVLIW